MTAAQETSQPWAHGRDEVCATCGRDYDARREQAEWIRGWNWQSDLMRGLAGIRCCNECGTTTHLLVRRDGTIWFPLYDLWLANGVAEDVTGWWPKSEPVSGPATDAKEESVDR